MLKRTSQRGFSLLEVMIALFVICIGLLGVVKLESVSLASTTTASLRSIAALEAASLAASMHVNRGYWANSTDPSNGQILVIGNVVSANSQAPALDALLRQPAQNCTTLCQPLNMAAYDLQQWAITLNKLLPAVHAVVNCGVSSPQACTITISWSENTVSTNTQETVALAGPSYTLYVEP